MADRTLRGSRLGAVSYETEYGTEPAPRNIKAYRCQRGHVYSVPFSEEADIPTTWDCRLDGTTGELVDGPAPEAKKVKAVRTHWDMLMERRTIADLEVVLAERLDVLRARRGQKSA
ncbi:MAG TPA: RNA polymerase-binding protein RbpA [Jatrophihabitantaceae bacterium]|jgi:RNA polymerase-binding protein